MPVHGIGNHNHKFVFLELGYSKICLQSPAMVKPLGVGNLIYLGIYLVGRDIVQDLTGVPPLDQEI